MAQEKETIRSYTERRLLREQRPEGLSIDAGVISRCEHCGSIYFTRKPDKEEPEECVEPD